MITSTNPRTEKINVEFVETTFSEIDSAVKRVKVAQKNWFALSKEERISVMQNMKVSFEKNIQELVNSVHEECGFHKEEVQDTVYDILDGFDYYISVYRQKKEDIDFPIDKNVFPESTSTVQFYPHGVIAQIGIWNYPEWQTMISAIPALLVGNGIVFKPSEKATKTGLLISKIINETEGFIQDVFVPIIGGKKEGKYLVTLQDIDAVVYTGNIKTGKQIISASGLKPKILELSGNDAAIVCKDCDMKQTVNGIVSGAFFHSGEVCDRIKRVYVVKDIAEEFICKIVDETKRISDKVSPLISLEACEKVEAQIRETVSDGASVLIGGKKREGIGFYFKPTILQLEHNDVLSVREEIFGPVFSVLVVADEEEALALANDSEYGLGTSIWTQDFKKGEKLAFACETGMVWINDSNIPLVCGEWFKGWKSTSLSNASDRLSLFMKSKTIILFNSKEKRAWWF